MKKTFAVAALAVASLGWISTAAAQPPEGGRMRRPGPEGFGPGGPGGAPPMERMTEHLGLTDDQKAQWKAIHETERASAEPLMKAAGEARETFDKALESDNADAAAIGQAAIAMRNAHRKVEASHQATLDAVKAILTPDQLAKFEEMEKHMRRPGPGGPGGHGGPDGQGPRRRPGPDGAK
jgi:periplasmic protein CpxP/Spy